jgi:hypothetical protein
VISVVFVDEVMTVPAAAETPAAKPSAAGAKPPTK